MQRAGHFATAFILVLLCCATSAHAQVAGLAGTLVVTNKAPFTATIIDVGSGRALATLPTGQGPHEVVMTRDGRTAVVTDYGSQAGGSTLTVIDVPGLRVARTITLGEYRRPHGIVMMPGDTIVAVTSEANRHVLLVHFGTGTIVKAVPTEKNGSHMVGVVGNGTRGWTGNIGSNSVTELDLVRGVPLRSIDVPAQPEAINVTPDGREVWVGSNATGKVSVVDAATGSVTTAAEGFGWPYRVLFSPDNALVLMPDLRNEELRFIERASRKEVHRMPFKAGGPQGIVFTPDGRYALMSLSTQARVAIIDVARRSVAGYIPAGETPDGIAYTPNVTRPRSSGSVRISELSWTDAERVLDSSTVVVIPIGAEAKEHGPHLPLNNDWLLAEYFARRVSESTKVVLYPTVNYHFYPSFVEYPGSTTLQLETARDVVVDIVRSIARHGPRRFYVLNTGVSTLRALAPSRDSLTASGIVMQYTNILEIGKAAEAAVRQQAGGTHADELETSMMLYMHPNVVQMAKAVNDYHPGVGGQGLTRDSAAAKRDGKVWSRSGTYGNATLATREKGRVVVEAQVTGMVAEIERLRRTPIR